MRTWVSEASTLPLHHRSRYSCDKLLLDLLTGCSRLFPLKWWMTQKPETLLKYVYQLLLFNNFLEPYWHFHWRVFWCSLLRYRDGFIESSQSHTSEFHRALPALHKSFTADLLIGTSAHILCECEALAALRCRHLGSFFLEPEDIKSLGLGAIWCFSKAAGLPWYDVGHKRPIYKA
jgi:hypothetical protein